MCKLFKSENTISQQNNKHGYILVFSGLLQFVLPHVPFIPYAHKCNSIT